MSDIVNINRPKTVDNMVGETTARCFLISVERSSLPDSYSFLQPGASMPVAAGESYEVFSWIRNDGAVVKQHLLVSSHGEFKGPLAFVRRYEDSILDLVNKGHNERIKDSQFEVFFTALGALAAWTVVFSLFMTGGDELGNEWYLVAWALFAVILAGCYAIMMRIMRYANGLKAICYTFIAHKSFYPDDHIKGE